MPKNLRKIRWLLVVSMFLSISLLTVALSNNSTFAAYNVRQSTAGSTSLWNQAGASSLISVIVYGLCFLGGTYAVRNVRRAIADLEPIKIRRGFAFDLQPISGVEGSRSFDPKAEVQVRVESSPYRYPEFRIYQDLQATMDFAALIGIILYTFQFADVYGNWSYGFGLSGSLPAGWIGGNSSGDFFEFWTRILEAFFGLCGALWVLWGVLWLAVGSIVPGLFRVLVWITVATAILLAAAEVLYFSGAHLDQFGARLLLPEILRLIYPAIMLWLVTRPSIISLMSGDSRYSLPS